MDPLLSGFRLRNRKEQDQEARSVRGDKADLVVGLVIDVPVQSRSPEARQVQRVVGVEAQRDESSAQLEPPSDTTEFPCACLRVPCSKPGSCSPSSQTASFYASRQY